MSDRKCITNMASLFLPYKIRLGQILIFIIFSSIISVAIPIIIQKIVDIGFIKMNVETVIKFSLLLLFLYVISIF
jgi:ABC-type multidrug transport system fused ATPase/permease subunit